MQDELIELQTKLAFQEEAVDALNATVADQDRRIRALEQVQQRLAEQLRSVAESLPPDKGHEPPPHY